MDTILESIIWRNTTLGDLFKIKHGYAFKGEYFSDSGQYILLTPGNFFPDGGIKLKGEKEKYYIGPFPKDYILNKGDLLIVMTDLTQAASILGSSAFIPKNQLFLHNQRLGKIYDINSDVNIIYLYYLLNASLVREQIKCSATGATVRHTAPERIYSVRVKLPPLIIQRKIAAILSSYDDLIENNLRRIKILEEMAQKLYREWFINFRFPGYEQTRFVDSPLGRIPEGWEIVNLGDIADQVRNNIKPETLKPDTPYVGLEHIPRRSITLTCWGHASEVQSIKCVFENRDILFGKIRPYFHKVIVAPLSGICSSDAIVIRAKSDNFFGMVLSCTASAEFVEHAAATSQGTKMPRANWDVLLKYQIPLPSQTILDYFNSVINEIIKLLQNLVFRNINLRQTRDFLLPKLISGELDVSDIEIEIPKEALA